MFLFSYLFNTRQFVGLIIAVLLASSQADGTHNNRRSTKPGPLTTKNCDLTVSSHIRDLCKAYYSSDCQDATTEAPAAPLVYDCAPAFQQRNDGIRFNSPESINPINF